MTLTTQHENENVSGDVGTSSDSDYLSESDSQESVCGKNIVIVTHRWFVRHGGEFGNEQGVDGEIVCDPGSLSDARSAKIKIAQSENVPIKFVTLTITYEDSEVESRVGNEIEGISKLILTSMTMSIHKK